MENNIWQKRAGLYDKLEWVRKDDFLDFFKRSCNVRDCHSVLDMGCGTGIVTEILAGHVKLFIGIDDSIAMLHEATAKSSPNGKRAHYLLQDAQVMAFPDDVFDLVTARMSCHHINDVQQSVREAYRVLRPGGRLLVCEGVPPDERVRERYKQIFALKEKRHTFLEADLVDHLSRAGYKNIAVAPYFMRGVSLMNWLTNSAVKDGVAQEIFRLHRNADKHFKKVYNLQILDGDIIMDWKFVIVTGDK
ncbi:MAG: class I SAM-dependent methyltransferase [Chloroflexi bacterium]|nr:class I SAM-dependent methyltransferase [Chloroflexota bacterium]